MLQYTCQACGGAIMLPWVEKIRHGVQKLKNDGDYECGHSKVTLALQR